MTNAISTSKNNETSNLHNVNNKRRSVIQILNSIEISEGKGFIVHRVFPSRTILDSNLISPFGRAWAHESITWRIQRLSRPSSSWF